ncbi:MAG: DUF3124 domain-containing protein [Flavobacteriales bacterium]
MLEENDNKRGIRANFVVCWKATTDKQRPVFQGGMISTHGPQGNSLLTEGVSILH